MDVMMCLFSTTSDLQTKWDSSAKSLRTTAEQVFSQIPYAKGPGSWSLSESTRKHHPYDELVPPVALGGISTSYTKTGPTTPLGRRRILKKIWNRFSRNVRLARSRPYPTPKLEVLVEVEVRRETVYEPKGNMGPVQGRLVPDRVGSNGAANTRSRPFRCKRVPPPPF